MLLSSVVSWCIQWSVQNIKVTKYKVISDAFPDLYPVLDQPRPGQQDDYDDDTDEESDNDEEEEEKDDDDDDSSGGKNDDNDGDNLLDFLLMTYQ